MSAHVSVRKNVYSTSNQHARRRERVPASGQLFKKKADRGVVEMMLDLKEGNMPVELSRGDLDTMSTTHVH